MALKTDPVNWHMGGPLPLHYAYIPTKRAWDKAVKYFLGEDERPPFPTSLGNCTSFHTPEYGTVCLVTFGKEVKEYEPLNVMGVVTHEVTHVLQALWEDMGEESPGMEVQAYLQQFITIQLFQDYLDYNKKELSWTRKK
jgi:hypothetical protein